MNTIHDWSQRWAIPPAALADLHARLGMLYQPVVAADASMSEAGVQARVRLAASRAGLRLFRNNVGVTEAHVRYGLANDSKQMNDVLKSADLIGIRSRIIQPGDVGTLIGQFVSLEVKHARWKWCGDDHEVAQQNWAALVTSMGGEARFVSDASHV